MQRQIAGGFAGLKDTGCSQLNPAEIYAPNSNLINL